MNTHVAKPVFYLFAMLVACTACDQSTDQDGGSAPPSTSAAESTAAPPGSKTVEEKTVSWECPDDQPTVIDICLGLTPDQVLAALQKHDEKIPIQKATSTYDYTDGAQKLRTEPFVSRIRAESNKSDTYFEFHFTAPPGAGKLTHMQRSLGQEGNNLPAMDELTNGLVKNYGDPDYRHDGKTHNEILRTLRWDFPDGRILCSDPPPDEVQGGLKGTVSNATGKVGPSGAVQIAERLSGKGFPDPAKCTKWLQIQLRTYAMAEPVRVMNMELSDFATTWTSAKETFDWLDKQEAKARKDRLQSAEMPDL